MGDVYVQIGPIDTGSTPPETAPQVRSYLQDAAEAALRKAQGFTANGAEGYVLGLKVGELKIEPKFASCRLTGELRRHPSGEVVAASLQGSGKVNGAKPELLVKDCVEVAARAIMDKAIVVIRKAGPG